jgi:hypothetical protein
VGGGGVICARESAQSFERAGQGGNATMGAKGAGGREREGDGPLDKPRGPWVRTGVGCKSLGRLCASSFSWVGRQQRLGKGRFAVRT